MTNAYAGYFDLFNSVAGTTITNAYGVYILNSNTTGTITNRYDLYASSANGKSYFAGNVGIGTTTPAANLEVNGTAKFDNSVTVSTLASGNCVQAGTGGLLTTTASPCGSGGGGGGTVTGVTAGTDLTGGGTSGTVTLNLDTTKIPQLSVANSFNGNQTINGTGGPGNFGLTVNQPSQTGILVQGPVTGVGAGLDLRTSGAGGKEWEILATGNAAIQGVGKLNIRDLNSSTDVLTIDTTDTVNIGNLAVAGSANAGSLFAGSLGASGGAFGTFGITSVGGVGVGPEFKPQIKPRLPAANLDVQGNALDTLIGDPGCGANFAGIGFHNSGLNCGNYSMVGDGSDTYIAAPTGNIYFRTNANGSTPMKITAAGAVGIGTISPLEALDVAGRVRSRNLAAAATLQGTETWASSSQCLGALTSANSACDTPNMLLTETTGNVPVLIMANLNGIYVDYSGCVTANFALVMDGTIIAVSNVWVSGTMLTSVTLLSLQFPAPGSHTFEVQESDDTGRCGSSTIRTTVGASSNRSTNYSTSTLIVREF